MNISEPFINNNPTDNFLFSIIGTNNDYFYDVIMNNYFSVKFWIGEISKQIYFYFDNQRNISKWSNFASLDYLFIPKNLVSVYSDNLILLNKELVQNGYITLCYIDKYYIKAYKEYNQQHRSHEIMTYQYDKLNNQFFCKDFFNTIKYETQIVSPEELHNSLKKYDQYNNAEWNDCGFVALRKINEFKYKFDKNKLISNLMLLKYDIEKNKSNVYETLVNICEDNKEYYSNYSLMRFFDLIYQQIKIMQSRVQYVGQFIVNKNNNDIIRKNLNQLMKKNEILRNKFLRLIIKNDQNMPEWIDDVIEDIIYIKEEYLLTVNELIKLIDSI